MTMERRIYSNLACITRPDRKNFSKFNDCNAHQETPMKNKCEMILMSADWPNPCSINDTAFLENSQQSYFITIPLKMLDRSYIKTFEW